MNNSGADSHPQADCLLEASRGYTRCRDHNRNSGRFPREVQIRPRAYSDHRASSELPDRACASRREPP